MTHALEPEEHLVTPTSINARVGRWLSAAAAVALLTLIVPAIAQAQGDGARFHWKGLSGTNVVPVVASTVSGNTNPFDPSHTVVAGGTFDATLALAGYAKAFELFDRSASVAFLVPFGNLSGDIVFNGETTKQSAGGFGDPMVQFGLTVLGPKAMKSIPDVLRYEPKLSVDVIGSLSVPLGEYPQRPAAQHRPEPLLRPGWRRGRLAARLVGARTPDDARVRPGGVVLQRQHRLRRQDDVDRADGPARGPPDPQLHEEPVGRVDVAVHGREGHDRRRRRSEDEQRGHGFTLGYQLNDNVQLTVGYGAT